MKRAVGRLTTQAHQMLRRQRPQHPFAHLAGGRDRIDSRDTGRIELDPHQVGLQQLAGLVGDRLKDLINRLTLRDQPLHAQVGLQHPPLRPGAGQQRLVLGHLAFGDQ